MLTKDDMFEAGREKVLVNTACVAMVTPTFNFYDTGAGEEPSRGSRLHFQATINTYDVREDIDTLLGLFEEEAS